MIRLNKFLAQAGISSRRGADKIIEKGNVRVNGKSAELGQKIDISEDTIEVRTGSQWETINSREEKTILALNKPAGYVTSLKKQGDEPIIKKLLPKEPRVFPVGRLDKDSEGLLLCTNMGDFAHDLTHPSSHIEKEYIVHCTIPRSFKENQIKSYLGRLAKGVKLDGKRTLPAEFELLRYIRPQRIEIRVVLREGRNRQIRRMLGSVRLDVVRLIRTRIGKLELNDLNLEPGEYTEVEKSSIL